MNQKIHEVYQKSLAALLAQWLRRRSRALSLELLEAALMLLHLNLDPLAASLASLYSEHPRGRPHYDPIAMLRALILMSMLQKTGIKNFAKDLRSKPRLAQIAG